MEQSKFLTLNANDAVKGAIVTGLSVVVGGLYQTIQSGNVLSMETVKTAAITGFSAGLAYLLKNILSNNEGKFLKNDTNVPVAQEVK